MQQEQVYPGVGHHLASPRLGAPVSPRTVNEPGRFPVSRSRPPWPYCGTPPTTPPTPRPWAILACTKLLDAIRAGGDIDITRRGVELVRAACLGPTTP